MPERIAIAPEVTYATNPGAGFVFYPFTREDMAASYATVESQEVAADLNPRGAVRVGAEQGGGYEFEVKLGVLNPLLAALFRNAWSTPLAISGNISTAVTNSAITGTGLMTNVQVGQWIKLGGLHSSVDGWHFVTAKPSNNEIRVASTLTNQTGSGDETITGSMLRPGTTLASLAIERQHTTEGHYFLALGQVPQTFRLDMQLRQLLSGRFGFYGRPETRFGATQAGSPTTAASNEILGPIDHIKAIREGSMGADTTLGFSAVSLDWNNNYQGEEELMRFGVQRVQLRTPSVTGQISAYLASTGMGALLDKIAAGTRTMISWRLQDAAGNAMVVTLHQAFLRQHRSNVQGNQQSKFSVIDFTAETDLSDAANPKSVQLDWFPA